MTSLERGKSVKRGGWGRCVEVTSYERGKSVKRGGWGRCVEMTSFERGKSVKRGGWGRCAEVTSYEREKSVRKGHWGGCAEVVTNDKRAFLPLSVRAQAELYVQEAGVKHTHMALTCLLPCTCCRTQTWVAYPFIKRPPPQGRAVSDCTNPIRCRGPGCEPVWPSGKVLGW